MTPYYFVWSKQFPRTCENYWECLVKCKSQKQVDDLYEQNVYTCGIEPHSDRKPTPDEIMECGKLLDFDAFMLLKTEWLEKDFQGNIFTYEKNLVKVKHSGWKLLK